MTERHHDPLRDTGLRQMLTYVLIALVLALILGAAGVYLVVRLFDAP